LIDQRLFSSLAAAAAADRRAVDANAAIAAGLDAGANAVAAGFDKVAAVLVAAAASEADAILDGGALALAHTKIALANDLAIRRAAEADLAARQDLARFLQRGSMLLVAASADELHAAVALLDLHRAARNVAADWAPLLGLVRITNRVGHLYAPLLVKFSALPISSYSYRP
jgi:hypothetical protein